jgi:hypothetical protein
MSSLFSFGIKQKDGTYKNYTGSINDKTDQYGNNVSIFESQTKEERDAKAKKNYIANGKVVWTDGVIQVAEKKATTFSSNAKAEHPLDDLPF